MVKKGGKIPSLWYVASPFYTLFVGQHSEWRESPGAWAG